MSGRTSDDGGADVDDVMARVLESHALLAEVSRSVDPASSVDEVLASVLAAMRRLVEFRGGSISLVENGNLRIAHADPMPSPEVLELRLPIGEGLSGRAAATGEPVSSPDLHDDPRATGARSVGSNQTMRSYLAVPLITLGEVVGVMQIDAEEPNAFDEVDQVLLSGLAAQVAGIIESVRRLEELTEINRLHREFISMVSHELRTPLTIVHGMLEVVRSRRDRLDAEEVDELLERADRGALRLRRLIEEVLLAVRIFEQDVRPEIVDVRIGPLVERVIAQSRQPAAVTVEGSAPTLRTDAELFERLVASVLDNAIVHGAAPVGVRFTPSGLVVRDHGPGLPPDVERRLGSLFVRGRGVRTTADGLGLGLPLALRIATLIGVDLHVATHHDGGVEAVIVSDAGT